jgi:alkyl hydroperoxide reductase subunit AhpC
MALRLGDIVPDFTAESTEGTIRFHDWIGDGWAILFSHPKDFTPVCTTELGYLAGKKKEFDARRCKIIGLSVDSVDDHRRWARDIEDATGHRLSYPLIGDSDLKVSKLYDMLPAGANGDSARRTAADNQTVRSVFLIGPDKKLLAMISYPMSTGRNFDEVLRLLDSIQLTAKFKVATPVNWHEGEDVIILASLPDDEARQRFPEGWRAPKPYMRYVHQPH